MTIDQALKSIPKKYRVKIIASYLELKRRYAKAHYDASWDASGLSSGKFCEAVFRFLQFHLTGSSIAFGKHIPNFPDECRKLIQLPKAKGLESLRVIIPRALVYLYTMRGKRGIGHVGGDVEANVIDASTILSVCDWVMSELIRVFHGLSLEEAQAIVDSIANRSLPYIWEVAGKKRVLRKDLSYKQLTLLLCYSEPDEGVLTEDLFSWCEHSKLSEYKRGVLKPLHKDRLIEYDADNQIVYLSPAGIAVVEKDILTETG
jgi:hypothetical protein